MKEWRKVSLSEVPNLTVLISLVSIWTVFAICAMGIAAYHVIVDHADSEIVSNGVWVLITAPLFTAFLWLVVCNSPSIWQKCPKGHVVGKDERNTKASYCRVCGVKLYGQNELSADEWKERYGEE